MSILVVGAGAMGSLFTAFLERSGHHVNILEVDREKVKAINKHGLRITGIAEFTVYPKAYSTPESLEPPTIVFLFTKAYSTSRALEDIGGLVKHDTIIVSLQNGIGNEEEALRYTHRVVGGITTYSAIYVKPGLVEWTGEGVTVIGGYPRGLPGYALRVTRLLSSSGVNVVETENAIGWKWLKAIVNSAINPIGTLLKVRNGRILDNENLRKLAFEIADEASRIALKAGIELPRDPKTVLLETLEQTRSNYNSMLQDVEKCSRTEIDYINGKIVEAGLKLGVNAPLNETMRLLIKALEEECLSDQITG
ncbi:MAG: 2-dehydropantoate 2-reductase [Desulfurococcales archaeon]|nr:2-dehydropantoate 2-reductase [Desulfurococcales archaeon]